ncbi:hypothetical protein BN874_840004 [Candidatus Contendobacter odensis Run_B_J11]|uniref:CopG family transcriptional regulator n=1 Tax=Candidatus Contendobacter odensis Run_B_J11 TaxID=1400861 RepID=A0A7U7J6B2_9GAMM|nr:hypothetical protein BN874_840004 [Candidatus Contendobacter odensis Run_B_J11]
MAKSKFDAVLGQRKTLSSEVVLAENTRAIEPTGTRSRGRPPGKRTHPDYRQVTIYIPRALHDQVKISLIQEGRKEFSELVGSLLDRWIRERLD